MSIDPDSRQSWEIRPICHVRNRSLSQVASLSVNRTTVCPAALPGNVITSLMIVHNGSVSRRREVEVDYSNT